MQEDILQKLSKDNMLNNLIKMKNGRHIVKVALFQDTSKGYPIVGTVLCHWGNIDPEEYVTWHVAGNIDPLEQYSPIYLETASSGHYIIGKEEAMVDFNQRQAERIQWAVAIG